MFGIAAIVLFCVAAVIAFGAVTSSLSVIGLVAVGLAALAAHLVWPAVPWRRPPP